MESLWCVISTLITVAVVVFVYKLLDFIYRLPHVGNLSERYIFITGCDSGFGNALAKRLDSLGCHVFAGCLTEKGETELKKICSERLQPVHIDISKHDSVVKAFELVTNKLDTAGKGLWGVVNNAGRILSIGPPEWMYTDDYRRTCDVNLFGTIDVTMTFLPLVKKTQGRIVNMASIVGRLSMAELASYSVSKYGIEAFTDALRGFLSRRSLAPYGCKTSMLEPGGFQTAFGLSIVSVAEQTWNQCPPAIQEEYTSEYLEHLKGHVLSKHLESMSDDLGVVVGAYEHALFARNPRARYLLGPGVTFMALLAVLPDCISDWLLIDNRNPLPALLKKRNAASIVSQSLQQ